MKTLKCSSDEVLKRETLQPFNPSTLQPAAVKQLVATGIAHGWIKAGGAGASTADLPLTNEEARDRYLECWWRIREIELERIKLDNKWLKEQILLLTFAASSARQS